MPSRRIEGVPWVPTELPLVPAVDPSALASEAIEKTDGRPGLVGRAARGAAVCAAVALLSGCAGWPYIGAVSSTVSPPDLYAPQYSAPVQQGYIPYLSPPPSYQYQPPPVAPYGGGEPMPQPRFSNPDNPPPDAEGDGSGSSNPPTSTGSGGDTPQPTPAPQASAPPPTQHVPSPNKQANSDGHSPTCGYWRFGCGILWP
jgi:hypothetical protein